MGVVQNIRVVCYYASIGVGLFLFMLGLSVLLMYLRSWKVERECVLDKVEARLRVQSVYTCFESDKCYYSAPGTFLSIILHFTWPLTIPEAKKARGWGTWEKSLESESHVTGLPTEWDAYPSDYLDVVVLVNGSYWPPLEVLQMRSKNLHDPCNGILGSNFCGSDIIPLDDTKQDVVVNTDIYTIAGHEEETVQLKGSITCYHEATCAGNCYVELQSPYDAIRQGCVYVTIGAGLMLVAMDCIHSMLRMVRATIKRICSHLGTLLSDAAKEELIPIVRK
eukprot:Sspe_Gene.111098::Locus_92354_Transcript_1_1_Confidence_1.000_Length_945::g.111098::m.111098